jgi:hypothetical protein
VTLRPDGVEQSLAAPDYAKPFGHFQFGLLEPAGAPTWQIGAPSEVSEFEGTLREWLTRVAVPWFDALDSLEGVERYCRERGNFLLLAKLRAHIGRADDAKRELTAFLRGLPRQIDKALEGTVRLGLLTDKEYAYLLKASMQSHDDYQRRLDKWMEGAV